MTDKPDHVVIPLPRAMAAAFFEWASHSMRNRNSALTRYEAMSTRALEELVFRYEPQYFEKIGRDHPDVVTLRQLVEERDLRGLRLNWGRLADSFVRLEGPGRPMIIDYYSTYADALVELCKRGIQAMTTPALEAAVFRFEQEYFDQFPAADPDVRAFQGLVESRDLQGLRQKWAALADSFMRKEETAHFALPFKEAYYLHFVMLVELCSRLGIV